MPSRLKRKLDCNALARIDALKLPEGERLWNTNGGIHFVRRHLTGRVIYYHWYRNGGSWGFIKASDGSGKALITDSAFKGCNFTAVSAGDDISYVQRDGPGGKVVVRIIDRVHFVNGDGVLEY